jgi:hypothetical protein
VYAPAEPPRAWEWVALEQVEDHTRAQLRGQQPVEAGRFLAYQPNLLKDPRLYTGFVAFVGVFFGVFLLVGMPLLGHEPDWIAGAVFVLLGVAAGFASTRLSSPQPRPGQGLYLLADQFVAFDGDDRALVIPRAQLRGARASAGVVQLVRHDKSWLNLDAAYVLRFRPSVTLFNIAFDRWVETGEPVFTTGC